MRESRQGRVNWHELLIPSRESWAVHDALLCSVANLLYLLLAQAKVCSSDILLKILNEHKLWKYMH